MNEKEARLEAMELEKEKMIRHYMELQDQADAIYRALTMGGDERAWRAQGLKRIVMARDPGDWVDDQLADIDAKRKGRAPVAS